MLSGGLSVSWTVYRFVATFSYSRQWEKRGQFSRSGLCLFYKQHLNTFFLGRSKTPFMHWRRWLVVSACCKAGNENTATPLLHPTRREAVWAWARSPTLWVWFNYLHSPRWNHLSLSEPWIFRSLKGVRSVCQRSICNLCALWVLSGRSCFSKPWTRFGIFSRFVGTRLPSSNREGASRLFPLGSASRSQSVFFPCSTSPCSTSLPSLPSKWALTE